jgi:CDP-diglyceride synthetase
MLSDAANWVSLVLGLVCCVLAWKVYRATRAKALLALLLAYIWSEVVTAGVTFKLPFLGANFLSLRAITVALHMAGMWLLLWSLVRFVNGTKEREEVVAARETLIDEREATQAEKETDDERGQAT